MKRRWLSATIVAAISLSAIPVVTRARAAPLGHAAANASIASHAIGVADPQAIRKEARVEIETPPPLVETPKKASARSVAKPIAKPIAAEGPHAFLQLVDEAGAVTAPKPAPPDDTPRESDIDSAVNAVARVDYSVARAAFERACDNGSAYGCAALGNLYAHGTGVPTDVVRAEELLRKGCAMRDVWACSRIKTRLGDR